MQPVELKRVRTLYACVGEHETELSFEPNMIISNGEMIKNATITVVYTLVFTFCLFTAWILNF